MGEFFSNIFPEALIILGIGIVLFVIIYFVARWLYDHFVNK
jgi:hypothetical protein